MGTQLTSTSIYTHIPKIITAHTVDLSKISFIHPWPFSLICLYLIDFHRFKDKNLILPTNFEALCYLKRMHFNSFLNELGYILPVQQLELIQLPERKNFNVQELLHCVYRDDFNARLGYFFKMFKHFGLGDDDAYRATAVIGELGNNVFDHNSGNWPTDISGCLIAAQHYPLNKTIEVVVGDPGMGFLGSLKVAYPELQNDVQAIKKGLAGYTGRVGEQRGNGLKLIQEWTVKNFRGELLIHSGAGLVRVTDKGMDSDEKSRILGTLAQFMIHYSY